MLLAAQRRASLPSASSALLHPRSAAAVFPASRRDRRSASTVPRPSAAPQRSDGGRSGRRSASRSRASAGRRPRSRSASQHMHEVFDADAESAGAVVAGFVRQDHAGQQFLHRERGKCAADLHEPTGRSRRRGRCHGRNRRRPSTARCAPADRDRRRASPLGKRATLMAIMPFRTSVKKRRCSSGTVPIATVRVMSVVPLIYCPPESIRNMVPSAIGQVALGRDAVMHDRRMFAGAGNGVEGNILQRVLHALADAGAAGFQFLDGGNLRDRARVACCRARRGIRPWRRRPADGQRAEPSISAAFLRARGRRAGSIASIIVPPLDADAFGQREGRVIGIDHDRRAAVAARRCDPSSKDRTVPQGLQSWVR